MDPHTGDIYKGTCHDLQAIEDEILEARKRQRELGERMTDDVRLINDAPPATAPFIPLTSRQAAVMKAKSPDERRALAKRVLKRRTHRKALKRRKRSSR